MTTPNPTQPSMGEGGGRFEGRHQHGWSPDIDEEHQEPNDSAHRSFDPSYAPETGPGPEHAAEEDENVPGNTVESTSRSGQDQPDDKDLRDTGPQGPSQRPSGNRTAQGRTGVDPQEPHDNNAER